MYETDLWPQSMEFGALLLALAIFGGIVWFTTRQAFAIMLGHPVEYTVVILVWVLMVSILKIQELVRDE